jgi:hypothetical protein
MNLGRLFRRRPAEGSAHLCSDADFERAQRIRLSVGKDLSDVEVDAVYKALEDRSDEVRSAAASYFGLTARTGKTMDAALPHLLAALQREQEPWQRTALANAIKCIVGAEELVINWDAVNVAEFRAGCESLAADTKAPEMHRRDARKYLKRLFGRP